MARTGGVKQLIVSADDFGRSLEINDAVERAHRNGILRSASLMVTGPAAADAVERARRLPALAVGLHLVLVFGRSALSHDRIPHLVDREGNFATNLFGAGVRYFFRPGIRAQLEAEIRAQFERFAATRLRLDHVNAQSHLHVHPTVFNLLLKVGREFDVRAVRIPREPIAPAYRAGRDRLAARLGYAAVTAPWVALMRRRARRAGIVCNDYAFGVNDAGAMTQPRALNIIDHLPAGLTEMFFHPATGAFSPPDPGTQGYAWTQELAALSSDRVRDAIESRGIVRVTYCEVANAVAGAPVPDGPTTASGGRDIDA